MSFRVKLNGGEIVNKLHSEEEYLDMHTIESLYAIRKFKALVESNEKGFIICTELRDNQTYSQDYGIWFTGKEFETIEV